jgi:hypothetical protein
VPERSHQLFQTGARTHSIFGRKLSAGIKSPASLLNFVKMLQRPRVERLERCLQRPAERCGLDPEPVVKFFNSLGAGTWLATELDEDGDTYAHSHAESQRARISIAIFSAGPVTARLLSTIALTACVRGSGYNATVFLSR